MIEVVLDVQLASAPEAMDLVAVVHLRREILDAVERGVRDAVEVFDAVDAEIDEVARRRFANRDVHGRRQADFSGFVERRGHLIAVHRANQLETVGAAILCPLHERSMFRGCPVEGLILLEQVGKHRVEHDARRDDRVCGALSPPLLGLLEIAADLTRRRHSGREVQVALVLDRQRTDTLLVPVHVGVDDAGHHVLAGGVDNRVWRRPVLIGAVPHARDQAILGEDVDRPVRRRRRAGNHHGVLDHQTFDLSGVNSRRAGAGRGRRLGRRCGGRHGHSNGRGRCEDSEQRLHHALLRRSMRIRLARCAARGSRSALGRFRRRRCSSPRSCPRWRC